MAPSHKLYFGRKVRGCIAKDLVKRYDLQRQVNGEWQTFHSGQRMGATATIRFKPVTATKVRVVIHESDPYPTFWELTFFETAGN